VDILDDEEINMDDFIDDDEQDEGMAEEEREERRRERKRLEKEIHRAPGAHPELSGVGSFLSIMNLYSCVLQCLGRDFRSLWGWYRLRLGFRRRRDTSRGRDIERGSQICGCEGFFFVMNG
jgi:hypothetical protein